MDSRPARVFISYTHDSPAQLDRVLALSDRLRAEGVDCWIDQYEESPTDGWPLWCEKQVEQAQFVLIVATDVYLRRFRKEEESGKGLGAVWEGHVITQELYETQLKNSKFLPIIFTPEDAVCIPPVLRAATRYELPSNYDKLYRRLTNQPEILAPALGSVNRMPSRARPAGNASPAAASAPPSPPPSASAPSLPVLERQQTFQTLWRVPYPRNPFFTGRQAVLDQLRQTLEARGVAAISGLGGVGKTETAIEFAWRNRDRYKTISWIRAETREQLLADLASFAADLNVSAGQAKEQEAAAVEARRWLESNRDWLLIFDNADDLALLKPFLPVNVEGGHILITTRSRALGGLAGRLALEEMSPDEGADFLLRRASIQLTPSSRALAVDLARELGGLPLALDQAAAYIEETPSTLAEYLAFFRSERGKMLAQRGGLGDHPSVALTFRLALEKVAAASLAAADLLRLSAFLGPAAVPEEIFTRGGDLLGSELAPVAGSPSQFLELLAAAGRFSLIARDPPNQTFDIHRLVQAVIRAEMPADEQQLWARRAIAVINRAFPVPNFQNWPACARLLPHALACSILINEQSLISTESAVLLGNTGTYLRERALLADAEPLYLRALDLFEQVSGPESRNYAVCLNGVAELFHRQGKWAEAEPLYLRALNLSEKVFGAEDSVVAVISNSLGELYRSENRFSEAERLYTRALEIWENALGSDDANCAAAINNLALLYQSQGRSAEAEPLFKRALNIWEKTLGPDHPNLANGFNNLGLLYAQQGRFAEAEPLQQRALALWEKTLGPDHPQFAISLNNLALLYHNQGKLAEAEPLYRRALAIWEKSYGPGHSVIATCLSNLAEALRQQGKYVEAEPLYHRALAIAEKAFGPEHPELAGTLNNLALFYYNRERYDEAEPLYRRALAIYRKALPPGHPDLANVQVNLAALFVQSKHFEDAESLYRNALAIYEQALGTHDKTLNALTNLAALLKAENKTGEAESILARASLMRDKLQNAQTATPSQATSA